MSETKERTPWKCALLERYFATGILAQPSDASVNSRATKHQTTSFFKERRFPNRRLSSAGWRPPLLGKKRTPWVSV
jgi:hypothetical protein